MFVDEVTSVTEMRSRYRAARRRLERGLTIEPPPVAPKPAPPASRKNNEVAALRERLTAMNKDLRLLRAQVAGHLKSEGQAVETVKEWPARKHWKLIIAEVAAAHGVPIIDLLSARRAVRLVLARHEAMWRLRNETTMSLPQIGRRLGGRDHTTVLHGIRKHEQRLADR